MLENIKIHFEAAGGAVSGFVADAHSPYLADYLAVATDGSAEVSSFLARTNHRFAILEEIRVEPRLRGRGIGNRLMSNFLEAAEEAGATVFVLVASNAHWQLGGFLLHEWLDSFHFAPVLDCTNGTLMVLPHSFAEEIAQEI